MKRHTELLFARCEPPLKKAVQELATETGRDVSKLVRAAVVFYLEQHRRWTPAERELEKAA